MWVVVAKFSSCSPNLCSTKLSRSIYVYSAICHRNCTFYVGGRLKDAWDLHKFLRAAEEELAWAREAEALLCNEDIGRDLQEVRFLLKNHAQLEADLALHTEKVGTLKETAQQLVLNQHFDASAVRKKSNELNKK